jgi:hypothetical protein
MRVETQCDQAIMIKVGFPGTMPMVHQDPYYTSLLDLPCPDTFV